MKALLIFASLFAATSANGQKHSLSLNYKPSLSYFGKQNQAFEHYYFFSRKGDRTFRSSANILYSYKLLPKIRFTTGVEFAQQGQNINFNADSMHPSSNRQILRTELNYFRIPVTVHYSILRTTQAELNLYSGVSLGMAVTRKDNYQHIILENIGLPPAERRDKDKDWAIPVGINYKANLTSRTFANFGLEYILGLTNAFAENGLSRFGVLSQFDNSKQNRLSLSVGIGFMSAK